MLTVIMMIGLRLAGRARQRWRSRWDARWSKDIWSVRRTRRIRGRPRLAMSLGGLCRRWCGVVSNEVLDGLGYDDVRLGASVSDDDLE